MKTQLKQNQIPKIKNQSYYFTNGGSGVDLSNLVLICEKKIAWKRATEERELEKRERATERKRELTASSESERGRGARAWEEIFLDCFTENWAVKQLTGK